MVNMQLKQGFFLVIKILHSNILHTGTLMASWHMADHCLFINATSGLIKAAWSPHMETLTVSRPGSDHVPRCSEDGRKCEYHPSCHKFVI